MLRVNTQLIKPKAWKAPANKQPIAMPLPEIAQGGRQSSETVAGQASDATMSATSSPKSSCTVSAGPNAAGSKQASLGANMLHHAERRRMSVAHLLTPFVHKREEGLEQLGTDADHWMPARSSEVDTSATRHKDWELRSRESGVRKSLQVKTDYTEREGREKKRRKTMGAMLKAFDE